MRDKQGLISFQVKPGEISLCLAVNYVAYGDKFQVITDREGYSI